MAIEIVDMAHWQPIERVTEQFEQGRVFLAGDKASPALAKLGLEPFHEDLAAQIMHLGPYAAEAPIIARLHAFIREQGHTLLTCFLAARKTRCTTQQRECSQSWNCYSRDSI